MKTDKKGMTSKKVFALLMMLVMSFTTCISAWADDEEIVAVPYVVNFEAEHASIDVYYSYMDGADADETNVTTAYAREEGGSEVDTTGNGQVNFKVNAEDGYQVTSVTASPAENYDSLYGSEATGSDDAYCMTGIAGYVTVSVVTEEISTETVETDPADDQTDEPEIDLAAEPEMYPTSISSTTTWAYSDDGTDPAGDETTADYDKLSWTAESFDDSGWMTAAGPFGAKNGAITDLGNGCTPNTLLNQYKEDGTTDKETFFFRTKVTVENAEEIREIAGSVLYDDCAIVYINGVEIASYDADSITKNMEYGGSNDSSPKTGTIKVTDADLIQNTLVSGVNEIAVEVHQGRSNSSDIYFDMTSLVFNTEISEVSEEQTQSSVSLDIGADESQLNLDWYNSDDSEGQVLLAKASELVDGAMPENAASFTATVAAANKTGYYSNQATLTGLEASTAYAYQLVNGSCKSEVYTFTTGGSDDFSFVLAGDPQIGASGSTSADTDRWESTLNTISASENFNGVNFLLSVGDQVNGAADEDQYDGFLEHSLLPSLPLAANIGNHDTGSDSYGQHFNIANESATYGTTAAGGDYYYVYNNVLFLCLNSNNLSTAEHKAFMEEAIEATQNEDIAWKVVAFHHSIYSVANHASESDILQRRNEWSPLFKELDIDVVLMGHDHVYCRTYMMDGLTVENDASVYDDESMTSVTDPDGILYVTVNSASGSKFYNIQNTTFEYAAVMNQEKVPNVSRVDVTDSAFTITTYRTSDMSVVDTFTINHTNQEAEDQAAADAVDAAIAAIPADITLDNQDTVASARAAYDALNDAAKEKVTNYQALVMAEKQIELLQAKADYNELKASDDATKAELKEAKAELEKARTALAKEKAKNAKVSGLKVSSKGKKLIVSYKENSAVTGYQVIYRPKTTRKYSTLKTTTATKVKSKTLKKGQTYRVRVRTYTIINGKKVYGKWTETQSVKCK